MDSQYPANYRSDEQLEAILLETAAWTVNGRYGQVLCTVASLRAGPGQSGGFRYFRRGRGGLLSNAGRQHHRI
jgi:hypothetical protein